MCSAIMETNYTNQSSLYLSLLNIFSNYFDLLDLQCLVKGQTFILKEKKNLYITFGSVRVVHLSF